MQEVKQMVKEINEADYFINRLIHNVFQEYLNDDITTKQAVLLDYVYSSKEVTIGELATHMNISSSAVSQLVGKLEKETYVKRRVNPKNRREILVSLGVKAREYFERQDYVEEMVADRLFTKLRPGELVELRRIMLKLKAIAQDELT